MQLTGHIYDSATGEGAGYATVLVVGPGGNISQGASANGSGDFYLNSSALDTPGSRLQFSKVGYDSVIVDPSVILEQGYVQLDPDPATLDAVTVTAKRPSYTGYIIAAVALLGVGIYVSSRKKRAIGEAQINYTPIILLGLGGVGVYLLATNFSKLFGSGANQSNNSAVDSAVSDTNDQALRDAIAHGYAQTISQAQATSLANDIWNQAISSSGTVSSAAQDRMVADFDHVATIADVYALKKAFGTRQGSGSFWSTCNFFGFNCQSLDLDTVMSLAMDQSHLDQINTYLSSRNINYQF